MHRMVNITPQYPNKLAQSTHRAKTASVLHPVDNIILNSDPYR